MKKTFFVYAVASMVVFGAGCSNANQALLPNYAQDASQFAQDSSSSVARGVGGQYDPAPLAPATSTSDQLKDAQQNPTSPAVKPNPNSPTSSGNRMTTPTSMSYTKALITYKTTGAYLEFVGCRNSKGSISMKKGVKFMLDNRDGKSHSFQIGTARYPVPAYGFAIATAPGAGQYYIKCDGAGAALLNVEQ